jgi:hypothetical protein
VPARWSEPLHVPLPGFGGRVLRAAELMDLAVRLSGRRPVGERQAREELG